MGRGQRPVMGGGRGRPALLARVREMWGREKSPELQEEGAWGCPSQYQGEALRGKGMSSLEPR